MGLLDGGLQAIVRNAFSPIFLNGTLHVPTRVDDLKGNSSVTWSDVAVKAISADVSEEMRAEPGYTQRDVQVIVLQGGVAATIDSDREITLPWLLDKSGNPQRFKVSPVVSQDPAAATWIFRATPV